MQSNLYQSLTVLGLTSGTEPDLRIRTTDYTDPDQAPDPYLYLFFSGLQDAKKLKISLIFCIFFIVGTLKSVG